VTPSLGLLGTVGFVIEAAGVFCIISGFALSAIWFVGRLRRVEPLEAYKRLRQDLGRSILLGLEFLVAGDIIRTVTVDQTLTSAGVLVLIVLIRVLLSFMLEYEINGRWPWQRARQKA
jgi:uncharacterized membrane protein